MKADSACLYPTHFDGFLEVFQFCSNERKISLCSAAGFTEKLPLEEKSNLNCLLLEKKQFLVAAVESGLLMFHVFNTL